MIDHDELAMIGEHESIELTKIAKSSIEPKPIASENENAFTLYRKELLNSLKDPAGQLTPALQVYCEAINQKYDLDGDERKLFASVCASLSNPHEKESSMFEPNKTERKLISQKTANDLDISVDSVADLPTGEDSEDNTVKTPLLGRLFASLDLA